jgi:hypothetical protein
LGHAESKLLLAFAAPLLIVRIMSLEPQKERRRLAELYAGKTREELEKLADAADSLTDPAREALKFELSRRKLDIPLREQTIPGEEVEAPKVVVLRQFRDVPAALLAKSILDSAEIECFLADVNTIRLDWLWSNALGGVKLLVRESDVEAAEELLDQKRVEGFDVEGMEHFTQPRCPHCQSLDVSFKGLNKHLAYGSIALGVPYPVAHIGWRCDSCGQMWEDPGDPTPTTPAKPAE